jgi:hypothetical protein
MLAIAFESLQSPYYTISFMWATQLLNFMLELEI